MHSKAVFDPLVKVYKQNNFNGALNIGHKTCDILFVLASLGGWGYVRIPYSTWFRTLFEVPYADYLKYHI